MHNDLDNEQESKESISLPKEQSPEELLEHLRNMIERLTYNIYRVVSVGLFSNHQLIFSFMLCSSVMQANTRFVDDTSSMEGIEDSEWHIFLHGNVAAALMSDEVKTKGKAEDEGGSSQEATAQPQDVVATEQQPQPSPPAQEGNTSEQPQPQPQDSTTAEQPQPPAPPQDGEASQQVQPPPPDGATTEESQPSPPDGATSEQPQLPAEDGTSSEQTQPPAPAQDGATTDQTQPPPQEGATAEALPSVEANGKEATSEAAGEKQISKPTSAKWKKSYPPWVTDSEWRQCQYLEVTFPTFDRLCKSLTKNQEQWADFKASDNPFCLMDQAFVKGASTEKSAPIFAWEKLTKFQRILLIKTLRLEVLSASLTQFIRDQLGAKYLSTGTFDLREIYKESMAKSPLIFILSPGCDPSSQLLRFAKELRGSTHHIDMISLGRGQGPKAEELISKAQILKGRWVFLQNCHLAASWMPRLQAIVEKFNQPNEDNLDPQFRLWLSSRPDTAFPVSILQSGIKMTVEAPQGLKANLLRTFGSSGTGVVTEKLYNDGSTKSGWRPLLYGLCLFNSVIHERKKYGTLGWNIPYEFNDSDLEVSILKLQMLLEEQEDIPWAALNYLSGEVTYGGRVTDDWDRRCLISLLRKFYSPALFEANFSYDSNHMYQAVPENLGFNDVLSFVEELPNYDMPDVFGMTENAEKACREFQATDIIETVISVQPRRTISLSGSQKSSDTAVLEIVEDIASRLPRCVEDKSESPDPALMETQRSLKSILQKDVDTKGLDKEKIRILEQLTAELTGNSALLTVLRQEIDRFNNLLLVVHTSLSLLTLAVKGEIIMSEQLEDAYEAMLTQHVPSAWKNAAYESTKSLSSWVTDLHQRVEFFSSWAKLLSSTIEKKFRQIVRNLKEVEGETDAPAITQPSSFWLSAFFFPQGFLTAVLQNHARKMSISVDSLTFRFEVMQQRPDSPSEGSSDGHHSRASSVKELAFSGEAPEDGVLVYGLFLDGARWDTDTHTLQDCSNDERFCDLPEIHFEPVELRNIVSASSKDQHDDREAPRTVQVRSAETPGRANLYECPLYRTSARAGTLSSTGHSTNFVTSVTLPSQQPADFWILRGVAMLCQLNE